MFKEYLKAVDQETINFLKHNTVENLNFPFYFNLTEIKSKKNNFNFFSHIILHKPEDNIPNRINSNLHPYAIDIFNKLSKKCKFKYKEIFRICLNLTFNNGHKKSDIHLDHEFNHKQLLLYIHADDLNSYTYIQDKNKTITVKPIAQKAIIWGKLPHYHLVPQKGYRLVLVYTFI